MPVSIATFFSLSPLVIGAKKNIREFFQPNVIDQVLSEKNQKEKKMAAAFVEAVVSGYFAQGQDEIDRQAIQDFLSSKEAFQVLVQFFRLPGKNISLRNINFYTVLAPNNEALYFWAEKGYFWRLLLS